jgi:hypothetical protein
MAKRMSNKERIQRRGLEAAAAAAEKTKKKERPSDAKEAKEAKEAIKPAKSAGTKAPTKLRSRSSAPAASQRLKLVWKVFNASGKEVAVFAYPEKTEADAMAEKLTTKSGQPHFVNGVKVPLEAT